MNLISGINSTSSALSAEKLRMDVVAQNIANAHTTKDVNGQPYQRKMVSFESFMPAGADPNSGKEVRVSNITNDSTPGEAVYDPQNPDADKSGMVQMPNVNLAYEMVDLMSSSRAYEANLSVVKSAKQMAQKALTIGH